MADPETPSGVLAGLILFCLRNRLVVLLLAALAIGWGLVTAPFDWNLGGIPRDPVAVDAIPDLGENQQIVFAEWPGRSPRDIEDQVTYPLTVALMGVPEVRTLRSYSYFGFATVYVIFEEGTEFYDSRTRLLEKLSSLPAGTLPPEVAPTLGPDATALGQVFWYTLEGRDAEGRPAGGWDLDELRTIQDYQVRDALLSVGGVAEVASVGGFVSEYQIDVDPDALRHHGLSLELVVAAVRRSNLDVGARSIEVNRVEYMLRGVGFIESLADIECSVVVLRDGVPVTIAEVATVSRGPALRRGALDKGGAEAVGGVVVVRHGENPLAVIEAVKARIAEIAPSLPSRDLADGRTSSVNIVPFYDRSGLIGETLDTLGTALELEILITMIIVLVMLRSLRSGLLVAGLLPLAVLLCFVAMKVFGVEANIVALSGIAIAIGTMVDMGVILTENIMRRLDEAEAGLTRLQVIHRAAVEVGGAVVTAVATTVIGFLPVFTLVAAEGKLFRPLAWTKTFALLASVLVALVVIPPLAHLLSGRSRLRWPAALKRIERVPALVLILAAGVFLTSRWLPLGPGPGLLLNLLFVAFCTGGVLLVFRGFQAVYPRLLAWCLAHKALFLMLPVLLVVLALMVWSGLGKEFMPPLDEGSFLYMPTTMPHASIGEAMDVLSKLDRAIGTIPEVSRVVGKLGRVESALDPAPISMIETVIDYLPEYRRDEDGRRVRQWRDEIRTPDDIWAEILRVTKLPGTTSAPKLQPIATRLVMLQSGMRAPMGIKVKGPDLAAIEAAALQLEAELKRVPSVSPATVLADRVVGKPYIEIVIDRDAIARHGLSVADVQQTIQTAVGGRVATTTVEGRERRAVRVRYARERRDSLEALETIEVATVGGAYLPLIELADFRYVRGPMVIKSEDTFPVAYVIFDKRDGRAEVDVVEDCRRHLTALRESGDLDLPDGVSYAFTGSFENQVRAERKLMVVLPLALALIFLVLYLQFRAVTTTLMVFGGIFVAWSGGFVLIWLYGQPWFLDAAFFGVELRQLFQIHPINLSVAIWVGFLALFGIASDDGVLMATYLDQTFARRRPDSVAAIRDAAIVAARRRLRPALMTSATTILALLPVLTSTGRGADIMIPMAIPTFGGLIMALLTLFIVPTLYCARQEWRARHLRSRAYN